MVRIIIYYCTNEWHLLYAPGVNVVRPGFCKKPHKNKILRRLPVSHKGRKDENGYVEWSHRIDDKVPTHYMIFSPSVIAFMRKSQ
jgi:hypothetical protein